MKKGKIKNFFKTAAILTTIIAGATGVAYATNDSVKSGIDAMVEKMKDKLATKIQNIEYNENNFELSFDKFKDATSYLVKTTNMRTNQNFTIKMQEIYDGNPTTEKRMRFGLPFDTKLGDKIKFEITAFDPYSKPISKITEKQVELKTYNPNEFKDVYEKLYTLFTPEKNTELHYFGGLWIEKNNLSLFYTTRSKTGTYYSSDHVNLTLTLPNHLVKQSYDKTSFENVVNYITANQSSFTKTKTKVNYGFFEHLAVNKAFEPYTSQGYKVSLLSPINEYLGHIMDLDMYKNAPMTYSGTFVATHPKKATIHFKQSGEFLIEPYRFFDEYWLSARDFLNSFQLVNAEEISRERFEFDPYITSVMDNINTILKTKTQADFYANEIAKHEAEKEKLNLKQVEYISFDPKEMLISKPEDEFNF